MQPGFPVVILPGKAQVVNKTVAVMVGIFVGGLAMAEATVASGKPTAEGIAVPAPDYFAGIIGDRPWAVQLVA